MEARLPARGSRRLTRKRAPDEPGAFELSASSVRGGWCPVCSNTHAVEGTASASGRIRESAANWALLAVVGLCLAFWGAVVVVALVTIL